jgi:hypothetical protein
VLTTRCCRLQREARLARLLLLVLLRIRRSMLQGELQLMQLRQLPQDLPVELLLLVVLLLLLLLLLPPANWVKQPL